MRRVLGGILFFSAFFTVLAGWHAYLILRLALDPPWPVLLQLVLTAVVLGLGVSIPASWLSRRLLHHRLRHLAQRVVYVWMGTAFLLLVTLVVGDLSTMILKLAGVVLPASIAGWKAVGAVVVSVAIAAYAVWEAVHALRVKPVEVALGRLPAELDGLTVVQLSDMHLGETLQRDFATAVVNKVNALEPDVVAITGDLVDGPVDRLREIVAPLADLRARYGVYFVTGNHEYYTGGYTRGADAWIQELGRLGIRVLRNERVSIGDDRASFDLAGVDDWSTRAYERGHGPNLEKALEGRDESRELVLLAHQPGQVFEASRHGVGLQLSGHTHGGQLWPLTYIVAAMNPFLAGLERVGDTILYVSRGTGFWGPPMRLAAPAEITRIRLRAS